MKIIKTNLTASEVVTYIRECFEPEEICLVLDTDDQESMIPFVIAEIKCGNFGKDTKQVLGVKFADIRDLDNEGLDLEKNNG